MSPRKSRQSPLETAFVLGAKRLDRTCPGQEAEALSRAASLAILRRLLIAALYRSDYRPPGTGDPEKPSGLAGLWNFCKHRDCPLLDEGLDLATACPADPRQVAELVGPVAGLPDVTEAVQDLREFGLVRDGQGNLSLVRGRTARRRAGLFFTPGWMVRRLVAMALDPMLRAGDRSVRILDPACGSGRLLLGCLTRLLDGQAGGPAERARVLRERIPTQLRGVDIDPLAVALTRSLLWILADPRQGGFGEVESVIWQGDAICGPLPGDGPAGDSLDWRGVGFGFDLVVANPPFEVLKGYRRRKDLKRYAEKVRSSGYRLALSGNLNTYRLFLERSLDLLAEGGRLAFVLPFGFLMDRTAAPLRMHLLRSGWIDRLEFYPESARAFSRVGQSVVLLSAAKGRSNKTLLMRDGTGRLPEYRLRVKQLARLDAEFLPIPIIPRRALDLAARIKTLNPARIGDLAEGRVGEVDQTIFGKFMKSRRTSALLLRGTHLSPYRADLDELKPVQRWLDPDGFGRARGEGRWKRDIQQPRVVQTGIVNMEAGRRLVAAEVPKGVYLGNSINYWVPKRLPGFSAARLRAYLLGLLNSTPLEWRFRVTSSNNNVNLYEVRNLPLPELADGFRSERTRRFLEKSLQRILDRHRPREAVRQIRSGRGSPARNDWAVALLIGRVAREREKTGDPRKTGRLDAAIDFLVNWHLGLEDNDLDRMLEDVPARSWKEEP